MKTTETKTTTSSRQQHQSSNQTPFFQKEGEGDAFFSDMNKANIQRSPFHNEIPFFQPAPQLKSQSGVNIQAKLTIGQPNDKYEKEADATADEVVQRLKTNVPPQAEAVESSKVSIQRKCNTCGGEIEEKHGQAKEIRQTKFTIQKKPIFESNGSTDLDIQRSPTPAFTQRKCADCEQKEKLQRKEEETAENSLEVNLKPIFDSNEPTPEENTIQAKTENEGITASSNLQSRLNLSKGSGQPLSSNTQNAMSTAIGADFSDVRVHTDSNAVQMSGELGAQAFTHGSDIFQSRQVQSFFFEWAAFISTRVDTYSATR